MHTPIPFFVFFHFYRFGWGGGCRYLGVGTGGGMHTFKKSGKKMATGHERRGFEGSTLFAPFRHTRAPFATLFKNGYFLTIHTTDDPFIDCYHSAMRTDHHIQTPMEDMHR